jgi:hypothetical protein
MVIMSDGSDWRAEEVLGAIDKLSMVIDHDVEITLPAFVMAAVLKGTGNAASREVSALLDGGTRLAAPGGWVTLRALP